MQFTYLPAINRDTLVHRGARPVDWMDPRLRGTTAYHPYALVSYPYWRRPSYRWEPGEFIFGDSGGFSLRHSSEVRGFTARESLRWQLSFTNLGVVLDASPWKRWHQWRQCLVETVRNVQAALPLYLDALDGDSSFRWWGVIHGRTPDECAEWHEAVSRIYPFSGEGEGWACKPWPKNHIEAVATILDSLRGCGVRRAHFFGLSGRHTVETLLALGPNAGLRWVTCDSTTPLTNANNRALFVPTPSGWTFLRRCGEHAVRDYMRRSCACTSCELLRQDVSENADRGVGYWNQRMKFHNVLVLLAHFERLRARYPSGHALMSCTTHL